ncbi:DNA-binding protein RFX8 [Plecturocebus cupreus]
MPVPGRNQALLHYPCAKPRRKLQIIVGDAITFEKSTNYNSIIQQEEICEDHSLMKTDPVGSPLSEFRRCPFWEQELAKKYSYKMMNFLADEYCNYCRDVLLNVRNQELERVEDLLTSFWKSRPQDAVMLMSLPDVCQLFKCYDVQLYKGIEDVLLHDFLEDVSIQYLKSVRLFSKKFKLWLLNALEGFPALLQISKLKEVTLFVKRLRRKTYLSNMAKTMRMVLKSKRQVSILKSNLQAIINQDTLATSKKALTSDRSGTDELESNPEIKCLRNLISLLGTSTDLSVFLSCLSSHLQAFVFQPSRSKEEFVKLAASFQLRWNLLLTAVSKAMTLYHRDSFGSWHLFHSLLLEYVIHILQSCLEEEEEEEDMGNVKEMLPDDPTLSQPDQALFHPLNSSLSQACTSPSVEPLGVMPTHMGQDRYLMGVSNVVLRILGFLVDTATGNKLIQVLLEDETTDSAVKLSIPMGQEVLITLKDGQQFVIQISDVPQSSEDIYSRESNANNHNSLPAREQNWMENEFNELTEVGFGRWLITNSSKLKEHVLTQCKEAKDLEKRLDELLTRITCLEQNINDLMELKNTVRELHEAYTSVSSQIDQVEKKDIRDERSTQWREDKIREKRVKRNEQSLQEIWDYVKRANLHLIGVPESDGENGTKLENTLQDIMQEDFPNLARQANIQVQEIQRTLQRYSSRRATPRHIIIRFTKVDMKEKMLRAAREKDQAHKVKPIRLTADLSAEILQARRESGPIFNILKEKNFQLRILYPAKLNFISEGEIKSFTDKQMLKVFVTTRPALQGLLKEALNMEKKKKKNWYQPLQKHTKL